MPVKRDPKDKNEEKIFAVLNKIEEISFLSGIHPFIVGGFCRNEYTQQPHLLSSDIDIMAQNYNGILLAGLIGSELRLPVEYSHKSGTAKMEINGIKFDFKSNIKDYEILKFLRETGLPQNNLSFDIISRDFTINTLAIGLRTWHMYDILGVAKRDLDRKMLETPIDPDFAIKNNPIILIRALKFAIRDGYQISSKLEEAMLNNAKEIKKLPPEKVSENLKEYRSYDVEKFEELFEKYLKGLCDDYSVV